MFGKQLPSSSNSSSLGEFRAQDKYPSHGLINQHSSRAPTNNPISKPQQIQPPAGVEAPSGSSAFRLGLLKSHRSLKERLSKKMSRLSSLDSTHTSSSVEQDSAGPSDNNQLPSLNQPTPLISITMSHPTTNNNNNNNNNQFELRQRGSQLRRQQYSDYSSRMRSFDLGSEPVDEDEDEFEDPPLPMPYSMSFGKSFSEDSNYKDAQANFQSPTYEELLDDRQGMNNSEQQFTKGEKLGRPSIDGSIVSELTNALATKKGSKGSKKDKQRRSKSPSSSSMSNANYRRSSRNSSRLGFFGLASKLKLTRKHESIAMLQLSILNSGFISLKTMDRNLQSFLPHERLSQREFEHHVKMMRRFEVLAQIEYRFASRYETYVCRHATQESNQMKNNYKRCIPYDYNRVVLKTLPNVPDSDYINASHVDSYLKPNAYIAAQGPNENTIEDFWRMIWEQKTFVIVMLTKVFDFIRVMCNQYWPVELNKPERYGNLEVTLLCEEPLADFVIRTIRLTKLRPNQAPNGLTTGNKPSPSDYERATGSDSEDDLRSSGSESELVASNEETASRLAVRAPKFRIPSHHRKHSPSNTTNTIPAPASTAFSAGSMPPSPTQLIRATPEQEESTALNSTSDLKTASLRPNEFLYPPASSVTPNHSTSIGNMTPISLSGSQPSPRTPSTAGLDRSSATRRAVKKKRREPRARDARQMRTHFLAPTESQFVDDDDENEENNEPELEEEKVELLAEQLADQQTNQDEQVPGTADEEAAAAALGPAGKPTTTTTTTHNERIIYQFHYNSWASHTCPFINSLLHFRRRVRICMDEMSKSRKTGPTVVHCNDGCGRTGTYLCIDANLELAEEDNMYDVFNYTKKMRQSRKFLIENLEQYKFVYDTIEEAMICNKTWFPVSELHKRLKHKSQKNPITKKNEYQREYEKITRMATKFSIGDCAGGHRVENREKNRDVSTVPPDNFRPYLTSFQSNDSTDYINAVFVDGYTRSKEYIVTEWPVHRTISDFWSLIYDHDCNSVILLANPGESFAYPSFLPSEKELRRKFGPVFSAEMVSYTHYQNIKSWIYTINKKIVSLTEVIARVKSEAKTTQVFQITCWPQGHRVPTSTNALVELMNMVERWRQRTAYGPVCVVSLNGKSRAGVYCAANVAIEQVVQHSEVDVFQAVKTVRRHRPQLIENMTEYKYCYDLILHYVLHYVNHRQT